MANSIDFEKPCDEPALIRAMPKASGGFRVVQAFGPIATARQLVGRDLLMAVTAGSSFEYSCNGGGLNKLRSAIKYACLKGFHHWGEADVTTCFASLKPKHFEDLPLPGKLKALTLLRNTGKLIPVGTAHPVELGELMKAARLGLPEGAASSPSLASAFLGRELRTLVSKAKVVVFTYMDNIIVGAREEAEQEAFAEALVEHFQSLTAGPLHIKLGPPGHIGQGCDLLGWHLQAYKPDFYLRIDHFPNERSFARFAAKLEERLLGWSTQELFGKASEYALHWCAAHGGMQNHNAMIDLTLVVTDMSEVEITRRKWGHLVMPCQAEQPAS